MQGGKMTSSAAKPKVAFLGPIGTYSHQAALDYFPASDFEHIPVVTIRDIFEAVQSGKTTRGVVPFENSTNGSVVFTLDLFADREALYPDINVCGETYLDVRHNLLGHIVPRGSGTNTSSGTTTPTSSIPNPIRPKSKPLASLGHIERIYSHPQAFGQCEAFLGAYLKGIERIDISSTSRAAELVKSDPSGTSAAIASSIAADVHGLDILARNIEDKEDNTTRFFVIRKGADDDHSVDSDAASKSLITFTTDHTAPGSLASVLDSFRVNGLNLTSINSRPSRVVPFQYIFFVEFEGSKIQDSEGRVSRALTGVAKAAKSWRWLGSWTDRLRR